VGSIERRIEALERAHGQEREYNPERERLLEQAEETHRRAWEKAYAEEAAGNPRRRELLEEVEEQVERWRRRGA
jgi:hypothetical protein